MIRFFSGFFVLMLVLGATCLFSKVQVGEEVLERFETQHPYAGKKGVVYEEVIHAPNAGYISIHFSKFDLAKNDYVEIARPDGRIKYIYKDKGKKVKHGRETISNFWATHIPGDTAIVRLYSKNKKGGWGFVIDKWIRGYEKGYINAVMSDIEDAQIMCIPCGNDDMELSKCYEGTTMYNKSKTVYRLLINGWEACTGWLLGSQGHLMTTNSCIESQDDVNNTDFEFMSESEDCLTDCCGIPYPSLPCQGTIEDEGSMLIRTNATLDYSLIFLPEGYNPTRIAALGYLQFRDELPTIGERIYLPQYPAYCVKKIAVLSDVDGPYCKIYNKDQHYFSCSGANIGYFADTSNGSSGAPVIAYNDNLVVALHHCIDCPAGGVPIPSIISDLDIYLPADAIGSPIYYCYCPSAGFSQYYEWIERVQIADLDNSSEDSPYSDFTQLTANLIRGENVDVSLTPGFSGNSYTEYWKILIDYNHDCDFSDPGEEVFSGSGAAIVTGSFTVPTSTPIGYTRMRVSMKYGGWSPECGTITYGEVEDYVVQIKGIIGYSTPFGSVSVSGNRRAQPFIMPENGTIESISMYHNGGEGNVIFAVYDDNEGFPQNQLATSFPIAVVSTPGWQTIKMNFPVYVQEGTPIWLAWVYENTPGIRFEVGTPGIADAGAGWSGGFLDAMPDPFGSSTTANYIYSIYATYTYY